MDEYATKEKIISALRSLVNDAINEKYSYIIFHISTHGSRMNTNNGLVDVFIPHDVAVINEEWDTQHVITADELSEVISILPSNVLFEAILDTCHSGSGIREADFSTDRKIKYLSPPTRDVNKRALISNTKIKTMNRAIVEDGIINHISWAGCEDEQTSADANINGIWNGAFTYYFCDQIRKSNNSFSREMLYGQVFQALHPTYTQNPVLHCSNQYKSYPFGSVGVSLPVSTIPSRNSPLLIDDQIINLIPPVIKMIWSIYNATRSLPASAITSTKDTPIVNSTRVIEPVVTGIQSVTSNTKQVLEIHTIKEHYTVGEPVDINIINNTGLPISIPKTFKGLTIINDKGQMVYPNSEAKPDTQISELKIGDTVTIRLQFIVQGTYRIRVQPLNSFAAEKTIYII